MVLDYTARDFPETTVYSQYQLALNCIFIIVSYPDCQTLCYFTLPSAMFAQNSDFAKLVPNSYQDTLAYRLCTLTSGCGALYIIGLTYYVREHAAVQGIPSIFTPSRYS